MEYINLTPHTINLNDGCAFEPSGMVARVKSSYSEADENKIAKVTFGEIENLPDPATDTLYIVSGMVCAATPRTDVVSPATGHPATVRNEKGQIVSVPCFLLS